MSMIADNVASVRERVQRACLDVGRSTDDVRLIGVSKFVDIERIGQALDAGILEVGENRAQELTEKLTFFKQRNCIVHFIGQLQTNKIKYICGNVDLIHSVDRLSLAKQLQQRAAKLEIVQDILMQVNIGAEEQKGGVDIESAFSLLDRLAEMKNLRVRGLMCVPPALPQAQVIGYFAAMREMLGRAQTEFSGLPLMELSMGMTHDFEAAIREGATMVRVGTGIFGARVTDNR